VEEAFPETTGAKAHLTIRWHVCFLSQQGITSRRCTAALLYHSEFN
jgi:hypothetical protein